ncbi:ACR3 family arsenite efflux pump ArsB [Leucobacter exalbidus]|uniref:ACR3 family arsenite efflux pump ArsB n=1 Tax=Leucobacter exalbidus TaxID=662960 RepID=A0A940PTY2_9MICO|nr:bile acid:sodium symporter [Leucobacter exalbidus]MBP1325161.1 ACR3 family arsenite efflux pump ArsB [Leucobacter exalbidus]
MERLQVPLYFAALLVGALAGLGIAQLAVAPVLAMLLYVTFLGLPFAQMRRAARDWRFLATLLVVNFVLVPPVAFALSRFIAHDQVLLVGVLFVLLTPCIDYVIVFTGLAGGAQQRLLAATPLLMLAQMLLLPVYLRWFLGAEQASAIDLAPLATAFVQFIVLPLAAAVLTQLAAARWPAAADLMRVGSAAMVPLMMMLLAAVVAAHISGIGAHLGRLAAAVPLYLLFAAIMAVLGALASRVARLDRPGSRAVLFSGVTRNSLVVLPLVLALPAPFELAALVVVTQTCVELVVMVVLVWLIPRLNRGHSRSAASRYSV